MSNKVFKRVAATLLAVLLLFYVGLQIYNSNHSSIQTETATYMTASDTIETTGYIVRNETYLTSDAGGVLNYVLEDGESVKENGVVAQIYASAEDASAQNQISKLQGEIDNLERLTTAADQISLSTSPDVIDGQITAPNQPVFIRGEFRQLFWNRRRQGRADLSFKSAADHYWQAQRIRGQA